MKLIFETTPEQKLEVYKIATLMQADPSLSPEFITNVVELALKSEGAFNLMELWRDDSSPEERAEVVADLQELVDEHKDAVPGPVRKPKISFENLEATIKDVKRFKKKLRDIVDQRGGINQLAKLTGIPQPSLSRFFASASMPRRTTLYKIAIALDLEEKDIVTDWAA